MHRATHAAAQVNPARRHGGISTVAALLALGLAALAIPMAHADPLDAEAERYRPLMIEEIGQALASAKTLKERAAAKDLDGAKKAWIAARVGWERAEVFTSGFVPDLDEEIDSWPNAVVGFHAIEAKLFGANTTELADEDTSLIYHLVDLDIKIRQMPLNAQGLFNGTARLAYEIGESKADGGESRYSATSIDDMRNNVAGIAIAYKTVFADALRSADTTLADRMEQAIGQMSAILDRADVKTLDTAKLRAKSEEMIIVLQLSASKIGLRTPTLEDITQG